jgi:hypothetical protein
MELGFLRFTTHLGLVPGQPDDSQQQNEEAATMMLRTFLPAPAHTPTRARRISSTVVRAMSSQNRDSASAKANEYANKVLRACARRQRPSSGTHRRAALRAVQASEKAGEAKEGVSSYVQSAEEKIKEGAQGAIDTVKGAQAFLVPP